MAETFLFELYVASFFGAINFSRQVLIACLRLPPSKVFILNSPSLLQYFFSSSELQRITTHIWGLTPLCSKHLSCIILQKNKEVDIVFHRDQFGERKYDRTPTSNRWVFVSAASCKDLLTRLNRSTCHSIKCIGAEVNLYVIYIKNSFLIKERLLVTDVLEACT